MRRARYLAASLLALQLLLHAQSARAQRVLSLEIDPCVDVDVGEVARAVNSELANRVTSSSDVVTVHATAECVGYTVRLRVELPEPTPANRRTLDVFHTERTARQQLLARGIVDLAVESLAIRQRNPPSPPVVLPHRLRRGEVVSPRGLVTHRIRWGLVAGGMVVASIAYFPVVWGSLTPGAEILAIPVVGPLVQGFEAIGQIASGRCGPECGFVAIFGGAILLDGLAQIGGLVMIGIGLVSGETWVVPNGAIRRDTGVRWVLAPAAPGATLGATLTVVNF